MSNGGNKLSAATLVVDVQDPLLWSAAASASMRSLMSHQVFDTWFSTYVFRTSLSSWSGH
jgi:hypothetical protein